MEIKGRIKKILLWLFSGRDLSLIDKTIYYLSNKKSSGWVIGNQLISHYYGKKSKKSSDKIIFLGGYPRSGTTLLAMLLSQHTEIYTPKKETGIFQDILNLKIMEKGTEINKKELKDALKNKKDLIEKIESIIQILKKKKKVSNILFKQPKYIYYLDQVYKYFPNAKYINITRDGKDATMSLKDFMVPANKKEWDYSWCCRQWVVATNITKKYKNQDNFLNVKYEDLVLTPISILNKICSFLEVPLLKKTQISKYYKNISKEIYPSHQNLRKPIDPNIIGKGRRKMTKRYHKIFNKIAGKNQKELGYQL